MFDVGFSELVLILFVGLIVLGPKRLPVAIRTVMGWIATVRGLANNVQNELKQELKLQELQESIKKAEEFNLQKLSPELSQTVEELKQAADKMRADLEEKAAAANNTIEEQIQEIKQANQQHSFVESDSAISQQSASSSHEEPISQSEELSPADLAELAEENDEMAHIQQYYPEDFEEEQISNHSQTEQSKTS